MGARGSEFWCCTECNTDTEGDPVTVIEESSSTSIVMSNDQPTLTRAFNRLADGLLNTKRTRPSPESRSLIHSVDWTPKNYSPS